MNKELTVLAIDTSTATMAGAICCGDQTLAVVHTEAERNHSIHIMTNIEWMIGQSEVDIKAIDRIVTGIGPGSYTGVRIAVTAAKTLAWINGQKVVGVSSLAGLAFSGILNTVNLGSTLVFPIMDARRGQVYTAAFQYDGRTNHASRIRQDQIVMLDQWCKNWMEQLVSLKEQGVETVMFVGDVNMHEEQLKLMQQAVQAVGLNFIASNDRMNGLALAKLGQGEWLNECIEPEPVHELVPNYAQLTEAEVKHNAKQKEEGKS